MGANPLHVVYVKNVDSTVLVNGGVRLKLKSYMYWRKNVLYLRTLRLLLSNL